MTRDKLRNSMKIDRQLRNCLYEAPKNRRREGILMAI